MSCKECLEHGLKDCETCPKPEGLDTGNMVAYRAWKIVAEGGLERAECINLVIAAGGTIEDVESALTIDNIYRRLNGNEQ